MSVIDYTTVVLAKRGTEPAAICGVRMPCRGHQPGADATRTVRGAELYLDEGACASV